MIDEHFSEHPKLDEIFRYFRKKISFYKKKLNHFESWSIKNSEMNGSLKGDIQVMLKQMLKEIGISQDRISIVLNGFYSNLYEFEAWTIINLVGKNKDKNLKFIDLFNKDSTVSKSTMNTYLLSLNELSRGGTMHTTSQLSGLCVFIQFILQGGRGGRDGFGGSENLILLGKQNYLRKINNKNKIEIQKKKENDALKIKLLNDYYKNPVDEDEDYKTTKNEILPPLNNNSQVVDDWESLCE